MVANNRIIKNKNPAHLSKQKCLTDIRLRRACDTWLLFKTQVLD